MNKLARLTVAIAFVGVVALAKAMAAPSVPSSGFKVTSGSLQATVNGETKTYKKGDTIPDQAVVTANSDAQVTANNGMTISVKAGTTYQAANVNGLVDVKATGGSVTVAGFGNSYVLGSGSEVKVSGGEAQVVSGNVSYTDPGGNQQTLGVGRHLVQTAVVGNYTYIADDGKGNFTTSLVAPPPPQQQTNVVSPSAP